MFRLKRYNIHQLYPASKEKKESGSGGSSRDDFEMFLNMSTKYNTH